MKNKKIKGVVTTLALAGSLYAASASAGPFVDTWNYAINSGFSSYTSNEGGGGTTAGITPTDINPATGFPTHLQWGLGNQQSAFRVGNDLDPPGRFAGKIDTNAAPVDTVNLFHDNFPVGEPTLVSATLNSRLTLSAFTPANSSELADFLNFDFSFRETLNEAPCVVADTPAGNPCNDIFVLADIPGAVINPDLSISRDIPDYDGNPYTVKIFLQGLKELTDAECVAAGVLSGCQGFTTEEGRINSFQASLQILGNKPPNGNIPEPSVLLLFGAGLCAMGWMKSRRRQA